MADMMMFPNTVEEFMEQYKIVDDEKVYTNGSDLVPIFRMMQWFEHVSATDTISRQAAIDAILHITNCKSVRELFEYNQLHHLTEMWSGGVNDAIDAVIGVDSAQLGTNLAEVGTDCISRQAAIDVLDAYQVKIEDGEENPYAWARLRMSELPPVQPEIIRCKDCKHWIPYDWMFSEVWQSKNIADYPEDEIGCDCCDMAMKANDFCSRVERRTDEP